MNLEKKVLQRTNNNDDSFITSVEAFLFAKRIQDYQKARNKIDKNLATMLLECVESIENFLESATFFDNENEEDESDDNVSQIIPSIENNILQAHRMFFCVVCNKNIKASGSGLFEHFTSDGAHLKHLRTYSKSKDDNQSISSNSTENNNRENAGVVKKTAMPILKEMKLNEKLPKKLREFLVKTDISQFSKTLVRDGHVIKMNPQYSRVCQMLQQHLYFRYPKIKVYAFGSVVNGLGHAGSDLDIFVDTENCFYNRLSKRKMKDAIYQIQRILSSKVPYVWDNFEPVVHARTPILRAYCAAEKIDCDLSFSNGLSTCNTGLIQYFIELQPISKQIIVFLKYWASQLQLGVNSYLLTLMVIFYLQQESLLPSVQLLQDSEKQVVLIDGWNANFAKIPLGKLKMPLATDFRKYLIGCFKFYGFDFDYKHYIICVLTGTRVPKQFFDHGKENQLPKVFSKYVDYMERINVEEADEVDELFSNHKPMVIQDPFELIHNVSKGVQENKLKKIINYLRLTYELLLDAKF